MCLLCMMHQTVQNLRSKLRGRPWFSSTLRMVALDRRFPMPGPCLEPLLECRAAELSHTKATTRHQRLRLRSKVGWPKVPVPRVDLDVARWVGFQKISEDFPIFSTELTVARCFQTLPFHGWQMLAAGSSKIIQDPHVDNTHVWSSFLGVVSNMLSVSWFLLYGGVVQRNPWFKLQTGFCAGSDTEDEEEEHISVMLIMLYSI